MNEHASVDRESGSEGRRARLRKRLLAAGASGFHDYELVEYLLALTFPASTRNPSPSDCSTTSAASGRCSERAPTPCGARASAMPLSVP